MALTVPGFGGLGGFGGMDVDMPLFTGFTGFNDPIMSGIQRTLSRAFEPFISVPTVARTTEGQGRAWHPMDVVEHPNRYTIIADAPGMTHEDIHVELMQDGTLNIRGRKRHDAERERKPDIRGLTHLYERPRVFRFNRTFTLPDDARADEITATIDNGVLTVTIPKEPRQARGGAKKIQVQAGTVSGSGVGMGATAGGGAGAGAGGKAAGGTPGKTMGTTAM